MAPDKLYLGSLCHQGPVGKYKDLLSRYVDSHVKDKSVVRPSYL